ncbi:MAG: AAA family ATPase [Novosphingobium sp.]|nr:AAA family ATPase [Novosphingobium sp.]
MNDETTNRGYQEQDLASIVSRFRRYLPISLGIIAAAVILAGIATRFSPKEYTAYAQLAYSPQTTLVGDAGQPMTDAQRDAAVEAQMQLVSSLMVASQVIKTTGMANDPELRAQAGGFEGGPSPDSMAAALLRRASTTRIGQTPLFHINYVDEDPLKAAKIANAFAEAYLQVQVDQKRAQANGPAEQLAKRVEELRRDAELADAEVVGFRVRNNLLNTTNSVTLESLVSNIDSNLAQARSEAAQVRVGGGSDALSEGIDVGTLSALRQRRAEAQQEVSGLQARYGDNNPLLIEARDRLAAANAAVEREETRVNSASGVRASAAAARAGSLEGSRAQAEAKLAGNLRAGVQLADLQRKADAAQKLYQDMLAVSGQQTANRALVQPDSHIVAPATPPLYPSSPKMLVNLLVGFAVGLAIAVALIYVRERWSRTLNTIDDIDRYLGVDFLNSVPTLQSAIDKPKTRDPAEAVLLHPMSSYAEAFRSLATTLLFAASNSKAKGGRVIGISSALSGEGKTTTSISMARVLAMSGKKVALLDIDLRRRSTTMALAPDAEKGWIEVMQGEATLDEIAFEDASGLILLPAARGAHEVQRLFDGDGFATLLADLRQRFEVVVVDTAPVLAVVDTRNVITHLDTFALVAYWRRTPIKAIRAALHQVQTVGGSIAGVAMTMVNLKTQAQSGYGETSYYYDEIKDYLPSN